MKQQKRVAWCWAGLAVAAIAVGVVACGGPNSGDENAPVNPLYDPEFQGIDEFNQPLTTLTTGCTFTSSTGQMTLVVQSGETAIISKRVVDSAILVNGVQCGTANSTTLKKIGVTEKTGRLPVSLLRYDLTGHDDEVKRFWAHVPLSAVKRCRRLPD